MKFKSTQGFTLVEILISIGLLSLISVGFLNLMENQSKNLLSYKKEYALLDQVNLLKNRFTYSSDCTANISNLASTIENFSDSNSSQFTAVKLPITQLRYGAHNIKVNEKMPEDLGASLTNAYFNITDRITYQKEYQGQLIVEVNFDANINGGKKRRQEIPLIFTTAVDNQGRISISSCQLNQSGGTSAPLPPPTNPQIVITGGECPNGQYVKGITNIGTPICVNFPVVQPPPPPSCAPQAELVNGKCVNRCNEFSYWNSSSGSCVTVWSYRIAYECGSDAYTQALVCGAKTGSCRLCFSDGTCGSWHAITSLYKSRHPHEFKCP